MTDSLEQIYFNIVENLKTPVIIFQSSIEQSLYRTISDFGTFKCISHNKAFTKMGFEASSLTDSMSDFSVIGVQFLNCFSSFVKNETLSKALLGLFSSSNSHTTVEAIKFEDQMVLKDTYTIKICKPFSKTFVLIIESISEELRAQMLAEEIAQAKEQFVANVSHEIRTPLNGILGYISMMSDPKEQSTLSDYQRNCFEQIYDCSMNLLYIMNDILDFSKLNADQMTLKIEPFDITECLERSYDVINPSAHEKGLESAFYIYPNVPPRIKGDFKKLRQILLNLLSNGVKFTNKGRIDTTVELINDPETGTEYDILDRYTIQFTIEDTGIGINEKNQRKLFKSFSQIDQSNQKIYQGTGLGLVISKKLIELMDGSIHVQSILGEGSKFIFTIKAEEARAISAGPSEELLQLLKEKNVLVVDDHVTNRITIASHLVQWGMKPFVCGSAEEALLYLRGGVMHFDLALIDMRMPKIDGNELADKIRVIEPTLPLIAISSTILSSSANLHKNFSFYISKPIKTRQLFNVCVATVKRMKKQERQPPISPTHNKPSRKQSKAAVLPSRKHSLPATQPPIDPELMGGYGFKSVPFCKELKRSFLIAEDLQTNQRVIRGFLEKLGFHDMVVVEDGNEALNAVRVRDFDVIMMDLKMPRMNGFETTKHIRKYYQNHTHRPFIIALTANVIGDIRDKCIDAGMDAYICKPINMNELARILNEACA